MTAAPSTLANPFPTPSPLERVLLDELVYAARLCYERLWSSGTAGNFSLRGHDGIVWQSPSGWNKGALDPSLFIPLDLATATVRTPMRLRPSLEAPVHLGIYRAVATARCVVHAHPPATVKASRGGRDLIFQGDEMQKHLGCQDHHETLRIPVITNPTPREIARLADTVAAHVRPPVPMVILAAHGVYAWGDTPLAALSYLEAVEFLCTTR